MNIQTQSIEAILAQQELQTKKAAAQKSTDNTGFAATLAEQSAQMTLGGADSDTVQTHLAKGVQVSVAQQVLASEVENFAASTSSQALGTELTLKQASGALDMWDSYAQKLRTPNENGNLREAYNLLEGIETQVSSLKANNKQTLEQNPELAGLVNELEIMSATEKIKFNRGDYHS